jgi:hypothetical protein
VQIVDICIQFLTSGLLEFLAVSHQLSMSQKLIVEISQSVLVVSSSSILCRACW